MLTSYAFVILFRSCFPRRPPAQSQIRSACGVLVPSRRDWIAIRLRRDSLGTRLRGCKGPRTLTLQKSFIFSILTHL